MDDLKKYRLQQSVLNTVMELKRDAINQQHMVIGGRVMKFCFKLGDETDEYSNGNIDLLTQKNHEYKFFKKPFTRESLKEFVDMVECCSNLNTPFLLPSRLTAIPYPDPAQEKQQSIPISEIIMAYDGFEDFYEIWFQKNPQPLFDTEEEGVVVSPFWRRQIKNMLCTIEYLHNNKVFHGSLNCVSNYVMVGDQIHLINPGIDGSKVPDRELNNLTRADILAFRDFLVNHMASNYPANDLNGFADWLYFVDLFDFGGIGQLKKHPVLMDRGERFQYYQDWSDYFKCSTTTARDRMNVWDEMDKHVPILLKHWDALIEEGSILHEIYTSNQAKPYETTSIEDLQRFIRNVIKHFKQHESKRFAGQPDVYRYNSADIERDISHTFSGYLAYIHNSLVRFRPQYTLTSERSVCLF